MYWGAACVKLLEILSAMLRLSFLFFVLLLISLLLLLLLLLLQLPQSLRFLLSHSHQLIPHSPPHRGHQPVPLPLETPADKQGALGQSPVDSGQPAASHLGTVSKKPHSWSGFLMVEDEEEE